MQFSKIDFTIRAYYLQVTLDQEDCQKIINMRRAQRTSTINDVGGLVAAINSGDFVYSPGQAFRFDVNGKSRDGLHRALACVLANPGSTITVDIATGLTEEELAVIDLGSIRTISNILELEEVAQTAKEAKDIASIGRALMLFDMQCMKDANHHAAIRAAIAGTGSTVVQKKHEEEWIKNHMEEIKRAATYAQTCSLPTKVAGLIYAIFYRINPEQAKMFLKQIADGLDITDKQSPIAIFRSYIEKSPKMDPKKKAAFLVKSWNAYRTAEPMERLLYRPEQAFNVEGYKQKPTDAVVATFTSNSTKKAIKAALLNTPKVMGATTSSQFIQ